MTSLLFVTVWISLALFVVAEIGKRRLFEGRAAAGFWWLSAIGFALGVVHVFLAIWINNDWDHAVAWQVTEARTRDMLGFGWGGLLIGNYLFLTYWVVDLWRWRRSPAAYAATAPLALWGGRAFVLFIIAPAAIVFAAGPRHWIGAVLVAAMIVSWLGPRTRAPESSRT